jgi:hypothetical protein
LISHPFHFMQNSSFTLHNGHSTHFEMMEWITTHAQLTVIYPNAIMSSDEFWCNGLEHEKFKPRILFCSLIYHKAEHVKSTPTLNADREQLKQWNGYTVTCDIWGSHCTEYDDYCLLWCDKVIWPLPVFWKSLPPHPSRQEYFSTWDGQGSQTMYTLYVIQTQVIQYRHHTRLC